MATSEESSAGHHKRLFVVGAIAAVMLFALALYAWSQGVDSASLSIGASALDAASAGSSYLNGPPRP